MGLTDSLLARLSAMNMPVATRPVRKLRDMDIDEISLVDRGANQHASILFSKALDQEDEMPDNEPLEIFDEDGNLLDIDDLPVGTTIEGPDGEELVVVADDDDDEYDSEYDEEYDGELVGKASPRAMFSAGKDYARGAKYAPGVAARTYGRDALSRAGAGARGAADRVGGHVKRNKKKYLYGGAGLTAAGAAGGGAYALNKSLGDVLLDELSKADDDERSQVATYLMSEEIEKAQAAASEAIEYAEQLEAERMLDAYISKASEYNLPIESDVLGTILMKASDVLDDEELDVIDQLFSAIGDHLFEEYGAVGDTDNVSVMDSVNAAASELVGKSAGDVSDVEARVAMYSANPEVYDMYLRENGGF